MKKYRYFSRFAKAEIFLIVGSEKELNNWEMKNYKIRDASSGLENMDGCFYTLWKKKSAITNVIWLREMNFTVRNYVTLSHECLHAAIHIMNLRGMIPIQKNESECLNYFHDEIYENFLNFLCKDYKLSAK